MAESGKNSKIGRAKDRCKAYQTAKTREKNKLRKILRHLRKFVMTSEINKAIEKLKSALSPAEIKQIVKENSRNIAL